MLSVSLGSRNSTLRHALIGTKRSLLTVYWLFAPRMVLELMIRHMVLFMIMFGIPPIIHCTIKPFCKFIRYHIYLRIVKGSAWVKKYTQIKRRYEESATYEEYEKYGLKLDELKGYGLWRNTTTSTLYSYQTIHSDLFELQRLIDESNDDKNTRQLMRFIQSRIRRNYCGITNPQLYSMTTIRTKQLIEAFIDKMCTSLQYISHSETLSLKDKTDFFETLRHGLGRTALCLSGGASIACAHIGVIVTLARKNLLPKIINGSSAGSFMAAIVCTTKYNRVEDLQLRLIQGVLGVRYYRDNDVQTLRKFICVPLARYWRSKSLLDSTMLRDHFREVFGELTFLEAYHKTGRILNISVTGCDRHISSLGLNYVTAPHVTVWSAVIASCGIPTVFQPHELYIKSPDTGVILPFSNGVQFCDGSLSNDLVMHTMTQFNVNHFIACQVNPHVVSFLFHSMASPVPLFGRLLVLFGKQLHHYLLTILENSPIEPPYINGLLTQTWTGDVTVVPDLSMNDLFGVLTNIRSDYQQRLSSRGSKATFKHMTRIHALCAIEFTIDQCLETINHRGAWD
eukprot:87110_1